MTTGISWTDATINPGIYGCSKTSKACEFCYAMGMAKRLGAMGQERYAGTTRKGQWTGEVRVDYGRIGAAFASLPKRKPARVFLTSMSDLLHEEVPFEFVATVYGAMAARPHLTFQVLTKRAARLAEFYEWLSRDGRDPWETVIGYADEHDCGGHEPTLLSPDRIYLGQWPIPNVWAGVTVENQEQADLRIPELLKVPAAVRFLSMEPLLSRVDLTDLADGDNVLATVRMEPGDGSGVETEVEPAIQWVIVGGESGRHARPMHPGWVRALRDQCRGAKVPFHFKQWGAWKGWSGQGGSPGQPCKLVWPDPDGSDPLRDPGAVWMRRIGKKRAGRLLDGVQHLEFPDAA